MTKHNWQRKPELDRDGRVWLYAFLCNRCKTLYLSLHSDFKDLNFADDCNLHEDCNLEIIKFVNDL